jgi:hypothetical protein
MHPLDPRHLGMPSGETKLIYEPLVHSAQTLHLSCVKISTISNELNQASTWVSSPRSTIGCVQNNFWAYGMFSTNRAPIFMTPTLSLNGPKWDSTLTHVTLEFHRVCPIWFLSLWYVRRKPHTFFASRLALYQMNWIKHPLELHHLGVLSGASKIIF